MGSFDSVEGTTGSITRPLTRGTCNLNPRTESTRQLIYGYPNEEAFFRDPRGALDHGVHEIRGSDWVERLDRENRASFGHALPYTDGLRHFFFGAKDASAQFLASGVEVEFFDAPTQSQQRAAARARVMELVLGPGFDG